MALQPVGKHGIVKRIDPREMVNAGCT